MAEEYKCPHCEQPIYDEDALLCHFCGESLGRKSRGTLGRIRYGKNRWMLWGIIIMILCGFFAILVF